MSVKLVNAEPSVEITFTADEFRGLLERVVGLGTMNGAWFKLKDARNMLENAGVEGLPR